jgi:cell division protein ZapA
MAQVNLLIHGKPYSIACDEGQERRVQEIGKLVDARVREIAAAGAGTTEPHLLVLASLVMMDEIWELRETVNNMSRQAQLQAKPVRDTAPAPEGVITTDEEREILAAIDHLAARIDSVAERISKI